MQIRRGLPLRHSITIIAGIAGSLLARSATAQTIIDQWTSVTVPPPPALKPVTIDPKTTALLMLDFNQQTCNPTRKPRCIASLPQVKKLLTAARAAGVSVVYSTTIGAKPEEIAADVAPKPGEPVVASGVDKFFNTDLEKILKDKGVTTVLAVGTAGEGAVLYTVSGATMRGMKVIVAVDGVSSETTYAEQYVAWHLMNAPRVSSLMTLTKIDDVKF
jgi:nicotinamidase-related amidase